MELLGGDAHLAAQAELTPVGEPGGGVHIHRRAVHAGREQLRRRGVLRDDGVAVAGGVSGDVADGVGHVIHHRHRQDIVQKLRVEIPLPRRDAGDDRRRPLIQTELDRRLPGGGTVVHQPLFRRRSAKLGELNGYVEEITSGQRTTRAYNCQEKVIADFEVKNSEAIDAYARAEYYGTLSGPFVNLVNNLSLTLVSVFGALLYMGAVGGLTPGQISSFVLYSRKFSGPINEIANIMGEFQSAIAAAERVFRLLEEKPEPADPENARALVNVRGEVEIEHLKFGYKKDKTVIRDFSLSVKSGEVVAIVGHTGAGKTTIINLLMRFYDPDGGTIKIDGQDVRELTRSSVRRAFTMVLQDTWLFAGTVYENIAYGNKDVTRSDVERVCKAARIHSFITKLPQGYDTVLNDNAVNISKGQKQLLTIARAMLLDSPMLILDEATSNVDTRTEQIIRQAMGELMKGRTCFVIAHRLSTVKNADKILVMRGGDVVEQGTHDSLMAKNGYYAELYYSQFETVK